MTGSHNPNTRLYTQYLYYALLLYISYFVDRQNVYIILDNYPKSFYRYISYSYYYNSYKPRALTIVIQYINNSKEIIVLPLPTFYPSFSSVLKNRIYYYYYQVLFPLSITLRYYPTLLSAYIILRARLARLSSFNPIYRALTFSNILILTVPFYKSRPISYQKSL